MPKSDGCWRARFCYLFVDGIRALMRLIFERSIMSIRSEVNRVSMMYWVEIHGGLVLVGSKFNRVFVLVRFEVNRVRRLIQSDGGVVLSRL